MSNIKELEPRIVWNNFYLLTRQPRPSKHEEKVRAFLLKWGKEHGVETFADETGNVIMRAPATKGYENRRGVILQAHMDMVPQKTADTVHDFLTDPIETEVVGEWLAAKGTTLGADDGIGVALAMSVMEDKTLEHGPVEVLISYDEETGMTGAEKLRPGVFKGDILLNLDSEDEGELCIGCAGGLDAVADFSFKRFRVPAGHVPYKLTVSGLAGGHSGMDISLYRANANKIIADALLKGVRSLGVKVSDFTGGSLRNAIPFEAEATVAVPAENVQAFLRNVHKIYDAYRITFAESDPGMCCNVARLGKKPASYIDSDVMLKALSAIIACPSGVIRMSQSMAGLTETSINLAIVRTGRGHLKVSSLMRSAVDVSKTSLARRVRCVFELAGAKVSFMGGYSGWVPKPDTPFYKVICDVWKKVSGKEMVVNATHGGLECALLGAKYPNWEMASIGPTIVHPHSPDERVKIDTVGNGWVFLKELLKAVPER